MGNAVSARLDHVRPQDIEHFNRSGVVWVCAGTGGVSTFGSPKAGKARWWRLPAGYNHGPLLLVENDEGDHWSWEPSVDMPLSEFKSLLSLANRQFR